MKSRGQHHKRLAGSARPCVRVVFVLLAVGGLCLSWGADAKVSKGDTKSQPSKSGEVKDEAKTNVAAGANAGLKAFGQMIPLGSRSRGVRIPSFDEGKPSSLIVADAMTRVDDDELFLEKTAINVYAEKKEEDMRIDMKTGTYFMDEQILTSTERSRVSRSDFQIEGDSMVYDTKSAQGKMVGNVEMIIFDASAASKKMNIQTGGESADGVQKTPAETKPVKPEEKK